MKQALSFISRIRDTGNAFIVDQLKKCHIEGLVPSHGDILALLYQKKSLTMKEIAAHIHRTRPTVTVLVNKLERQGYVKRTASAEDNRYTYITLTEKAKHFYPVFTQISDRLNKLLYRGFSKEQSDQLEQLLQKMAENLAEQ